MAYSERVGSVGMRAFMSELMNMTVIIDSVGLSKSFTIGYRLRLRSFNPIPFLHFRRLRILQAPKFPSRGAFLLTGPLFPIRIVALPIPTTSTSSVIGTMYGCTRFRTRVRCSNAYA